MGGGGGRGVWGVLLYYRKRVLDQDFPVLRLLRTFAGILLCSRGKNSYGNHFKGEHGKLYIVGKLNNVNSRKTYELPGFLILQKKIAKMTAKMTMPHSIRQMN